MALSKNIFTFRRKTHLKYSFKHKRPMTLVSIDSYIEIFLTLATEKVGYILHSKYTTIINKEK